MADPGLSPPDEASGKAVVALVFSLLGLTAMCVCIGSILGIALGWGEKSSVGRAAVVIGWIGLAVWSLVSMAVTLQVVVTSLFNF